MAILSRPSFLKNSQDLLADVYITYAWFVYIWEKTNISHLQAFAIIGHWHWTVLEMTRQSLWLDAFKRIHHLRKSISQARDAAAAAVAPTSHEALCDKMTKMQRFKEHRPTITIESVVCQQILAWRHCFRRSYADSPANHTFWVCSKSASYHWKWPRGTWLAVLS